MSLCSGFHDIYIPNHCYSIFVKRFDLSLGMVYSAFNNKNSWYVCKSSVYEQKNITINLGKCINQIDETIVAIQRKNLNTIIYEINYCAILIECHCYRGSQSDLNI